MEDTTIYLVAYYDKDGVGPHKHDSFYGKENAKQSAAKLEKSGQASKVVVTTIGGFRLLEMSLGIHEKQ